MAVTASGIFEAIGLVGTALGIVDFAENNWAAEDPQGASVRIKAGLHKRGDSGDSLSGEINRIYAFDTDNVYIGKSDGCYLDAGGICTKTIDSIGPGRVTSYLGLSNNDDATCIAWITVKQYDDTPGGAWTGDIGYNCGQTWYNSIERAGKLKDGGQYIPKCTWLDGDHSGGIESAAMRFDTYAYGVDQASATLKGGDVCAWTKFGPDNGPIAERSIHTRSRPAWITDELIMSNYTSQPAAELCGSETSWGPDFIGPDGNFCDMEAKTLMPLCSAHDVNGCIEIDEDEGAGGQLRKRTNVARRSTTSVHKAYKKISKWGQ